MMRSRTFSTSRHGLGGERARRRTRPAAASAPRAKAARSSGGRGVVPVSRTAGAAQIAERQQGQAVQGRPARRPACSQRFWPSAMPGAFHGKSGEQMAAQPFARPSARPRRRGCGWRRRRPEQAREGEAEGREEGQHGRQAEDAERAAPRRIGRPRPGKPRRATTAGDEIAEAPAPADEGGGLERRGGPGPCWPRRRGARSAGTSETASAGRKPKGGMASAPTAPAAMAASQRAPPGQAGDAIARGLLIGRRSFRTDADSAARRVSPDRCDRRRPPVEFTPEDAHRLIRRGSASRISNSRLPGPSDQLAARRHAAGERDDEAAEGVDVLGAFLVVAGRRRGSP